MNKADQQLLEDVLKKIKYSFVKHFLVKPLPDKKVKKELSEPLPTGKKGKDGIEIYDTTSKVEEVLTDFKEGIVLCVPTDYEWREGKQLGNIKPGDTIIYPRRRGIAFDLYKDSELVDPYEVFSFIKA